MHVAVYLALVLPLVATVSARWLATRLDPRVATWLLTGAALGLAATSGVALGALAATAIGQIPMMGMLGDWSVEVLRRNDPASLTLATVACVALAAALTTAGRAVVHRIKALVDAVRTARKLPTVDPSGELVIVDDPTPDAYALPGVPGRIVVSTGMLDALHEREQRVLLAHERAHLACGHHLFVTIAQVAAATNPLLLPVAAAVRYTTERWADERAASVVGDRRLVARTIGKAALLTPARCAARPGALAITGVRSGRAPGPPGPRYTHCFRRSTI